MGSFYGSCVTLLTVNIFEKFNMNGYWCRIVCKPTESITWGHCVAFFGILTQSITCGYCVVLSAYSPSQTHAAIVSYLYNNPVNHLRLLCRLVCILTQLITWGYCVVLFPYSPSQSHEAIVSSCFNTHWPSQSHEAIVSSCFHTHPINHMRLLCLVSILTDPVNHMSLLCRLVSTLTQLITWGYCVVLFPYSLTQSITWGYCVV